MSLQNSPFSSQQGLSSSSTKVEVSRTVEVHKSSPFSTQNSPSGGRCIDVSQPDKVRERPTI